MSKAARTKEHLQATALRMFSASGYDNVTIEEVAAEAGVSHMTFYRYFPTKESAVLEDPYDPMIGAAVAAQPESLPVIERIRRGFSLALSQIDPAQDEEILQRVRLAVDNRSLRARIWENNHETEAVIVEALGSSIPRKDAHAAAGAVLGAITAALIIWAAEGAPTSLAEWLGSALEVLA